MLGRVGMNGVSHWYTFSSRHTNCLEAIIFIVTESEKLKMKTDLLGQVACLLPLQFDSPEKIP